MDKDLNTGNAEIDSLEPAASSLRIMIAGSWRYPMYEKSIGDALVQLGHSVIPFSWEGAFRSVVGKAELKYAITGPCTQKLNERLVNEVAKCVPNILLVWRRTCWFAEHYLRDGCRRG